MQGAATAGAIATPNGLSPGLLAALGGEMRPVPILGEHYQRWFAGVFV